MVDNLTFYARASKCPHRQYYCGEYGCSPVREREICGKIVKLPDYRGKCEKEVCSKKEMIE